MKGISARGILVAAAVLVVAAVCVGLGFWQLDRREQRRQVNAAISDATALPPVSIDSIGYAAITADPGEYLFRQATAQGEYVGREIVLRGRSHQGSPGVHLVVPLRLDDGGLILVNRGWLPSPDAATVDPRPYRTDERRLLTGLLQAVPQDIADILPVELDLGDTVITTYRRLDHATLERQLRAELPTLYLQELPSPESSPELPVPIPAPELDEGPHLGYAIQWFAFGAIAVLGFLFVSTSRRGRERASRGIPQRS